MENKSPISSAKSYVLIGAILYVVLPDLLIGPFDDAAVVVLSGIAELILTIVGACSRPTVVCDPEER